MKFKKSICALALLAASGVSMAQEDVIKNRIQVRGSADDASPAEVIRKVIPERLSGFPNIVGVRESSVPGIYEIQVAGNGIFYSDKSGDHLFQGILFDTKNKVNLSQQRIDEIGKIDFKEIPTKDGFKVVKGAGTKQVVMFSDPNCGYCKQMEKNLVGIDDVTVHVMLYPILGQDSVAKAHGIWCSDKPSEAYLSWMLKGEQVPSARPGCDVSAVDRSVQFGQKHGINGTPTLFFEDGSRVPGMMEPDKFREKLASTK